MDKAETRLLHQANLEAVVALLRESEEERQRLTAELATEQDAVARWEEQARRRQEGEAQELEAALAEAQQAATEATAMNADLQDRLEAAEARAAKAEVEVTNVQQTSEALLAEASEAARAERERLEGSLRESAQQVEAAHATMAAEVEAAAARVSAAAEREAEVRAALEKAESELRRREEEDASDVASAKDRASAAEKASESMREELRRSVGVERQRVAGMLYKEAMQAHTLEAQAAQIEQLNTDLADAHEALRESKEMGAEAQATVARQSSEVAAMQVRWHSARCAAETRPPSHSPPWGFTGPGARPTRLPAEERGVHREPRRAPRPRAGVARRGHCRRESTGGRCC